VEPVTPRRVSVAVEVGGWRITARDDGRVYLTNAAPDRDPGLRPAEARAIAAGLTAAADKAERHDGGGEAP
jgi:hypothetical protein